LAFLATQAVPLQYWVDRQLLTSGGQLAELPEQVSGSASQEPAAA